MALDVETLTFVAPELASTSDEKFAYFLSVATAQINASVFGTLATHATLLLIAHMITVGKRRGNMATTQEKVGDLSRSYFSPKDFKSYLLTSGYGQELWALIQRYTVTAFVCGADSNNNPAAGLPEPVIPGVVSGDLVGD